MAEDSAMYWSKDDGELCKLIDKSDNMLDDYRAFWHRSQLKESQMSLVGRK